MFIKLPESTIISLATLLLTVLLTVSCNSDKEKEENDEFRTLALLAWIITGDHCNIEVDDTCVRVQNHWSENLTHYLTTGNNCTGTKYEIGSSAAGSYSKFFGVPSGNYYVCDNLGFDSPSTFYIQLDHYYTIENNTNLTYTLTDHGTSKPASSHTTNTNLTVF